MTAFKYFQNPPEGYGIVPFYWWMGDPLTRERLNWQLDKLSGHHLTGLQINYAHKPEGGRYYGLTYPSDPPIFSDSWWELVGWLIDQGEKQGFSVSLSDYTLGGVGQGGYTDWILARYPELHSYTLEWDEKTVKVKPEPYTYDPMNPQSGKLICEYFFGEFERRFPGETGKGLNYFFSDELDLGLRGKIWTNDFAEQFKIRKGYDIEPWLKALFEDMGDKTAKIRLDYSDVVVQLEEERYFKPVYDWHEARGMTFGCDPSGRGKNLTSFGDYFRIQKYYQAPGCDQPALRSDIVKNKVASSISHLYERKRVWLEGFHGSGWGTSTAQLTDALARNYAMGQNLWSPHGLYYSTYGGFWEWSPPCNCFRMPYWEDMKNLTGAVERLSYILSQGKHVCDIAIVYPVAAIESGLGSAKPDEIAFKAAETLYSAGLDPDFIDFESILRAECSGGKLRIAGESYRIVIVPAMETVRFVMLKKLLQFKEQGGIVVALEALPQYSDRVGANDPELNELVRCLFPEGFESSIDIVEKTLVRLGTPDFKSSAPGTSYINHRRIDTMDLYMVYGVKRGTECFFRSTGRVSLWNPYNGKRLLLKKVRSDAEGTWVIFPLEEYEFSLVCFDNGDDPLDGEFTYTDEVTAEFVLPEFWDFALHPCLDNRFGDFRQPSKKEIIGPELRLCAYEEQDGPEPPEVYTRQARFGYGPYFQKAGPFADTAAMDKVIDAALKGDFSQFQDYEFSLRYGIWDDPGKEGVHGLKELVSDEFMCIGERHEIRAGTEYRASSLGDGGIFAFRFRSDSSCRADILTGTLKPDLLWVDGKSILQGTKQLDLEPGIHTAIAAYRSSGRTFLAFAESSRPKPDDFPLSMKWFRMPGLLPFDGSLNHKAAYGYYRFISPPGLQVMEIPCKDEIRVWIEGREIPALRPDGNRWSVTTDGNVQKPAEVTIRVKPLHGASGGAVFDEQIYFSCGAGKMQALDWSTIDGLASYSGGAEYSCRITLPEPLPPGVPMLELTDLVSSARVIVNGYEAGVRTAPPWRFSLENHLLPGDNEIHIMVHNTLANHYQSIPTHYRGNPVSGIMGPAYIRFFR